MKFKKFVTKSKTVRAYEFTEEYNQDPPPSLTEKGYYYPGDFIVEEDGKCFAVRPEDFHKNYELPGPSILAKLRNLQDYLAWRSVEPGSIGEAFNEAASEVKKIADEIPGRLVVKTDPFYIGDGKVFPSELYRMPEDKK